MKIKTGAFRLFVFSALAASAVSIACVAQDKGATAGIPSPTAKAETAAAQMGTGLGPSPEGVLPPVAQPLMPETIPGYTELDPETGLHMTGTPVLVDLTTYRLKVTGAVERELELTYDDIRRLPRVAANPVLICEGFFRDTANWAGASLASLLDLAGVRPDALQLVLTSADGYSVSVSLREAQATGAFLAYELEGNAVPVIHGFPVRAVFPSLLGYNWAKWLVAIRVS